MSDPTESSAPTLGSMGQILVSAGALDAYMAGTDAPPHRREECRRDLTETLISARLKETRRDGSMVFRRRDRGLGVDMMANVARDGQLLVVVGLSVRGAASAGEANARRRIVRQ